MTRFPKVIGRVAGGLAVWAGLAAGAGAQTIEPGASPGRAAYRPAYQWNDGPYFTAGHVDPYAPHPAVANDLVTTEPLAPPYSTEPHGLYSAYSPERGALGEYAEGFSPYSGFAPWYQRTYNFRPSEEQVDRAAAQFFRSAPWPFGGALPLRPDDPGARIPTAPTPKTEGTPVKVLVPGQRNPPFGPGRIPVYRSSVLPAG